MWKSLGILAIVALVANRLDAQEMKLTFGSPSTPPTVGEPMVIPFTLENVPAGGTLIYEIQTPGLNATVDATQRTISWTPKRTDSGLSRQLHLRAEHSPSGKQATTQIEFQVASADHPPRFQQLSDQPVVLGEPLVITPQAADPDGDPFMITIHAVDGQPFPPSASFANGSFRWTPTAANTAGRTRFAVRFQAIDARTNEVVRIEVPILIGQTEVPTVFTQDTVEDVAYEGLPWKLQLHSNDGNKDPAFYDLSGLIDAKIDANGLITWTPGYDLAPAGGSVTHTGNATVTDGKQANPDAMTIRVEVRDRPRPLANTAYALERCRMTQDLLRLEGFQKEHSGSVGRRSKTRRWLGIVAALIAVASPFSEDLFGAGPDSKLPHALGLSAGAIGVFTQFSSDPLEAQRRESAAQRGHMMLAPIAAALPEDPDAATLTDPAVRQGLETYAARRREVETELANAGERRFPLLLACPSATTGTVPPSN